MQRLDRTWSIVPRTHDDIVEQLLANRDITDREKFFNPDFERDSHDPLLLPNMQTAVDRIKRAMEVNETICVYGDYDADGIPGTALLLKVFAANGVTAIPYIPDREKEGYGLNLPAIDYLKGHGVTLLITVDLGITNKDQAAYAASLGIDVIVTDHHHVEVERLPTSAIAIVHPALSDSKYPFHGLAGSGVAWKLGQAIAGVTGKPTTAELKWWFELPAISTVCDMVPLRDENRTIVHYGLKVLQQTRNVGLKALYKAGGIKHDEITEGTLGFQIGPRINAPGRVDHAAIALELLMTEDPIRAEELAAKIELQNRERQDLLETIVAEACVMIDRDHLQRDAAIVLVGETWPLGLIGLVASRVVERYHRPTLLLGKHSDGIYKGSGRSIETFNLLEGIHAQRELLTSYGGHEKAAGVQVSADQFDQFKSNFIAFAAERLSPEELIPTLKADAEIRPEEITDELVTQLERFRPFGMGNPGPKFVVTPLTVVEGRAVGASGDHLKLRFKEGSPVGLGGIAFRQGARSNDLKAGTQVKVFGVLEFNEWNGTQRIQIKVEDIKRL